VNTGSVPSTREHGRVGILVTTANPDVLQVENNYVVTINAVDPGALSALPVFTGRKHG